jgi:predicted ATPase/class 3 adenylate cyclase
LSVHDPSAVITLLFTDIEGSTQLWDQAPERMQPALARHDALARAAVAGHRGTVVKMTGDGLYAAFDDSLDALAATLALQQVLADPEATNGVTLRVRCGLHAGTIERRDNEYYGSVVNRTARIMEAAHGGQIILSQAVADRVAGRLPQEVSLRDLGSVRLRDLSRAERVYQMVHPQLRQDFPALRSLEATPNNLPQQVSSFIGREHVLAEVKGLLGNTRLLTLLGVGGLGKTRLSLQVGADVMDDYPDGVWFVELAPLADARLVPQAVASALGVKEEPGRPVQEALVKHIHDRQLLLILDNCEHLSQACAELAKALLQAGPQVKVLASSRESLHVAGETTFPVPPLSVPQLHRSMTVAALKQYEAVRLFSDRAVAAQPVFQVTDQNATAVAEICHRLDGIPLALELAAARVRTLPVEAIAARLSDRFRLLTGGYRTSLPRQQTLRACIDWSYDLLSATEQALLRRLAVFAGGWTLEAAEKVGADGEVETRDVLDLLTHLGEKSLVQLAAEGARYRLLETVRQYAKERLNAADEKTQTRTRHLAFYLELAEEAMPHLMGPEQGAWLSQLDVERENVLAAHTWCDRAERGAEFGLRLLCAGRVYWITRGLGALGQRMTAEALGRPRAMERNLLRCRALDAAGYLGYFMGRYGEAQAYEEESLAIAREIGDKDQIVAALTLLGAVSLAQENRSAARGHLEESLVLARELGDTLRLEQALTVLAELHRIEGDLDAAEPLYEEALALNRQQGAGSNIAVNLLNVAMVAIGRGSGDRARRILLEAVAIADKIGSKPAGRAALDVAAGLAALLVEWERAARLYGAAQAQLEETGIRRETADEAFLAPLIAKVREALGEAAFVVAEAGGRALSYEEAMAEARGWLEQRF